MPRTNVNRVASKYRIFNDWLRGELKRRRIRQATLAEYLHISQQALSNKLNGRFDWSFREVLEVLEFLDAELLVSRKEVLPWESE